MAVRLVVDMPDPYSAAELADAILAAADAREAIGDPGSLLLALRWRRIADRLGDALDTLPRPAGIRRTAA